MLKDHSFMTSCGNSHVKYVLNRLVVYVNPALTFLSVPLMRYRQTLLQSGSVWLAGPHIFNSTPSLQNPGYHNRPGSGYRNWFKTLVNIMRKRDSADHTQF